MIREASSDYEALQACEDAEDDPDITMDQKYLLDEYFMKKWPNFGREAYELADEFSGWGLSED